ncbi:hypothetical protein BKA81DRAFT_351601 [Phyllosticta paracitricarpa]
MSFVSHLSAFNCCLAIQRCADGRVFWGPIRAGRALVRCVGGVRGARHLSFLLGWFLLRCAAVLTLCWDHVMVRSWNLVESSVAVCL